MFKELINNVQEKYKRQKEEAALYNDLIEKTSTINKIAPLPAIDKKNITISHQDIVNICPDINDQKAQTIIGTLPIDELYLTVMYSKECKTNKEYFIVPTTKYLWFISLNGYIKYYYENSKAEIIKSNLLSKILMINNILFEVNGNNEKITNFLNLINNQAIRENLINKKMQTLCGLLPIARHLNNIGSGISFDESRNIVFHTKTFNYKYNIKEISNFELLLDDNVISEKRSYRRVRLTSNKNSCSKIDLRISTIDKVFNIPILEKGTFSKVYQATSNIYIDSINFAKKIMEILDEFDEKNLNGE